MTIAQDLGKGFLNGALFGIEIEVEAVGHVEHESFSEGLLANVTEDGSLRNNGMEIISRPIDFGKACQFFIEAMKHTAFTSKDPAVRHTERTSTHVHVNMLDLEAQDVRNLVLNYFLLEPGFFAAVAEHRQNNIYCVPLSATNMLSKFSRTGLYEMAYEGTWHKYTAFNLIPLRTQGTIEFRHLQGTGDYGVFMEWLYSISRWRGFCTRQVPRTFTDALALYKKVFNTDNISQELHSKLEESFLTLQLVLNSIDKTVLLHRIKEHKACAA